MRLGMSWPGAEIGARADQLGAAAFCSGEFVDHDAYVAVANMAAHTSKAQIGSGIAYAFARTPYAHAAAARHLHATAGDRLFLGFGAGAFKINRDWFGVDATRPVARMAECVQVVKAFLAAENGERITFSGEFYDVDAVVRAPVLGRIEVPILIGAFNKNLLAVSGQVADGIIAHNLFTSRWWDEVVRPAVDAGRAANGRTGDALEHGLLTVAINDEDPDRARRDAKLLIAFYLTVKPYDTVVQLHGWSEHAEKSRAAFNTGNFAEAAAAITDEMLAAICFAGTEAEVREQLAARGNGLPKDIGFLVPPSFMVSGRRKAAYAEASLALLEGL